MHAIYGLYGVGMLFAGFILIVVGHRVMNRPGVLPDTEAFGIAEGLAYLFTLLIAIGLTTVVEALVDRPGPITLAAIGGGMVALLVAVTATVILMRRVPAPAIAPAPEGDAGRRGRPDMPRGPGHAGGKGQRRAA